MTQVALYLSLSGYLVFFIVCLAMHGQTQPQYFILASDQGSSGWNEGTAWLLAISNSMYALEELMAVTFPPANYLDHAYNSLS